MAFYQSPYTQSANNGASGFINTPQRFQDPQEVANIQLSKYQSSGQAAQDSQALGRQELAAKTARFNQIYGLLGGQLGQANSSVGGTNTAATPISTGPVLNPQQIQQQVNQSNAQSDQATQGAIQRSDSSLSGRGFGANSPLSMALNQASNASNLANKTGNETNLRLNAAQQNAGQLLNSQQALSNQWATENQLDIQRRAQTNARYNALLGALGGLV